MDLWPPFCGVLITHTHPVGLLWTSDHPVAETSTYTGQQNRQTSMPSAGFAPATPAIKLPQTYTLDRAATGIGNVEVHNLNDACVALIRRRKRLLRIWVRG
jgi:hypothetical protein